METYTAHDNSRNGNSKAIFYETADSMSIYLKEIRNSRLLSAEEEHELAERIANGDEAAKNILIESNLRLVVKIAKQCMNRGLPLTDLIAEGNIGLIKAVERFKAEKNCRFSTYATWWIKQGIERALTNHVHTIRLPVHLSEDLERVRKITVKWVKDFGREPTKEELMGETGFTLRYITRLATTNRKVYSLDQTNDYDDDDRTMQNKIEDESVADPSEAISNRMMQKLLADKFNILSEREKAVLSLRFGLANDKEMTLENIGKHFGLTRERIRQIQIEALKKMRESFIHDGVECA